MSEAIKRMLAERARLADRSLRVEAKWDRITADVFDMIDKAAPFMDEGCGPTKWNPSSKLKILYLTAATSPRPEAGKEAMLFVLQMLDKARSLWVGGLHPDPWADQPRVRGG